MEEHEAGFDAGHAGMPADQEFAEEFTRIWKRVDSDAEFQARKDYPILLGLVGALGWHFGLELLTNEQELLFVTQGHGGPEVEDHEEIE
jgi:hypothetical protein